MSAVTPSNNRLLTGQKTPGTANGKARLIKSRSNSPAAGLLAHSYNSNIAGLNDPLFLPVASSSRAHAFSGTTSRSRSGSPVKTPRNNDRILSSAHSASRPANAGQRSAAKIGRTAATETVTNAGLGKTDIANRHWDQPGAASLVKDSQHSVKKKKSLTGQYDRFIPQRENSTGGSSNASGSTSDLLSDRFDRMQLSTAAQARPDSSGRHSTPGQPSRDELSACLGIEPSKRMLSFGSRPASLHGGSSSESDTGVLRNDMTDLLATASRQQSSSAVQGRESSGRAALRRIPDKAYKVLDAPGLVDDYYLNLMDWSSTQLLAIGLGQTVYLWSARDGSVRALCSLADQPSPPLPSESDEEAEEYVSSLKFSEDGAYLGVSSSRGPIAIYDVAASRRIRTMQAHTSRVNCLSWSGGILSSGAKAGKIYNSDVRIAQHKVAEWGTGHRSEVCGLAWRPESADSLSQGAQGLLASGGNDNIVHVWDGRNTSAPRMTKTDHVAAVKAIAWSPWQSNLLATGGGTSDKTIHFWNCTTSTRLSTVQTHAQVTSIVFNPHARELLSSHGAARGSPENSLTIWSYTSLSKLASIDEAHDTRVLHTALSPDGCSLATASADESLKVYIGIHRLGFC
ncbi:uncharacterized protein L969DRAFT_238954 [Mixia osmundae IAM 14324]|uniref:uncharacterized protein n=1 Tax=Mixia osmundae (strain CBS 9802 / IAM 14324 / JCM 22182 / KY 12970) TaxID=764103 RepID=UPI0004A54E1F|nr:uncharacterized protein L969DRAFT_238954 [Mixia osmundae IAM 14324]KEI36945.1 hypothetical protein L969DRAFT_238954 [Mixia osmundae IAM 14324]